MEKRWPLKKAYVNFADDTFVDEVKDLADETKSEQEEIEEKSKPKNYACNFDECKSLFVTKKGLKRYKHSIHLNLKPFKCTECSSTFTRKEMLQNHMNTVHLKLKSFKCRTCETAFATKQYLRKHIQTVHEKAGMISDSRDVADTKEIDVKPKSRIYACNFDECKSLFVTKKGLKRHKNSIHLNLRPFKCTECPSTFTRKDIYRVSHCKVDKVNRLW